MTLPGWRTMCNKVLSSYLTLFFGQTFPNMPIAQLQKYIFEKSELILVIAYKGHRDLYQGPGEECWYSGQDGRLHFCFCNLKDYLKNLQITDNFFN